MVTAEVSSNVLRADAGNSSNKVGRDAMAEEDGGSFEIWESLAFDNYLVALAGDLDIDNRYSAAVMVTTRFKGGVKARCSGVVIDSSIVLTAGHCVCARQAVEGRAGERRHLIDTSGCAERAVVETVNYVPTQDRKELGAARRDVYKGSVEPHPGLQVLLDERGSVIDSSGDLAVIYLETPLDVSLPVLSISEMEVRINEEVVIVGYGYDELLNAYGDERRFCKNKVTEVPVPGGERVLVEQPGKHIYRQDSGGPCLREDATGVKLVGISSRNLGEGSACISIHGHRDWLAGKVQHPTGGARP